MIVAVTIKLESLDKIHHEIRSPVVGRTAIEQACDVGMLQRRKNLTFVAKSTKNEISVHPALDNFYGNLATELTVCANGFIDRPHTTAPDFAFDFVTAQHASEHRIHFIKLHQRRQDTSLVVFISRHFDKAAGVFKLCQEFFDFRSQFGIIRTFFGKEIFTRRWNKVECLLRDLFDLLPMFGRHIS